MSEKVLDTNSLIENLSAELEPVKPASNPLYSILPWVFVTFIYTAISVYYIGIRADFAMKLEDPTFLFELLSVGVMGIWAAIASAYLRVPDLRGKQWVLVVPSVLFVMMAVCHLCHVYVNGFHMPHMHWHHCIKEAGIMGGAPILLMLLIVRTGFTTKPKWMAFMNVLAVGSIGWIGLRLSCGSDDIGHTFMYHFFPFIVLGLILSALARRMYRW